MKINEIIKEVSESRPKRGPKTKPWGTPDTGGQEDEPVKEN